MTNAFSERIENYSAAVALGYFAYYFFIKIHRSLRVTPAMAAGVTDRLWDVSDFVALIEAEEQSLGRAASQFQPAVIKPKMAMACLFLNPKAASAILNYDQHRIGI